MNYIGRFTEQFIPNRTTTIVTKLHNVRFRDL